MSCLPSYFAHDNLKLNKRLSVNVGLNHEHRRQPVDTRNHLGSFDVATNSDLSYPDTNVLGLERAMVKRAADSTPSLFFPGWGPLLKEEGSYDMTFSAMSGAETPYTGWGTGMVDLDNDGFPDIFLVAGNVYPKVENENDAISS
ncbi:hypothetical protein ACPOL_2610 [Acidisarcina polymorpha]|uniref:Uncharacterized protein n=1 Tax=Acidisarcina polymorpha TaxID=2211140 RepID=A0A2Z5G016_9BACT|nr:hypothetical protein [Acidisarcina polymorpha]AXC11926.1 hypothetical protein ACPOL_2610 [Acidisarcina polymorpha]